MEIEELLCVINLSTGIHSEITRLPNTSMHMLLQALYICIWKRLNEKICVGGARLHFY